MTAAGAGGEGKRKIICELQRHTDQLVVGGSVCTDGSTYIFADFITLSGQLRIQIAERIMLHTHRSASMVYTNIGHTLNIHGIASFIWFGLVWFDVIQKHQNTTMISHKTLQRQFLLSNIISK